MAVDASLFISLPGVQYRSVGEHGAPFIRDVQNISMAFLALLVFKRSVGDLALLFVIVGIGALSKVNDDIFNAVGGFSVKEIKGVMGGREMAIHAICNKALGVIDMGRGFPSVVGELNFVTGGAKLGCRCPDHGVVADAENWKADDDAKNNKNSRHYIFFPLGLLGLRSIGCLVFFHILSKMDVNRKNNLRQLNIETEE